MILRWSRGISCWIILVIIFMGEQLLGQMGQIKAVGKILIPTASGEKCYDAVINITQDKVEIECSKKIFQLFNEFDTPLYRKLKVNNEEISNISVSGSENEILIITKSNFYQRYKHLFIPVVRLKSIIPYVSERRNAIIFTMDNPTDIGDKEKELFKFINKKIEGR
jgi:hypothetical protein